MVEYIQNQITECDKEMIKLQDPSDIYTRYYIMGMRQAFEEVLLEFSYREDQFNLTEI